MCVAAFPLDNQWYRGVVRGLRKAGSQVYVHFVDFGSTTWCDVEQLRKTLFMKEMPVQCLTLRLGQLRPMDFQQWDRVTLDFLHSTGVG